MIRSIDDIIEWIEKAQVIQQDDRLLLHQVITWLEDVQSSEALLRKRTSAGAHRALAVSSKEYDVRLQAMLEAERLNDETLAAATHEENLALLRSQSGATFYVMGRSAKGQGDVAFIVRTVELLHEHGLRAIAVKYQNEAHAGGNSFADSIKFMDPDDAMMALRDYDFFIEGPIVDRIAPLGEADVLWIETRWKHRKTNSRTAPRHVTGAATQPGPWKSPRVLAKQRGESPSTDGRATKSNTDPHVEAISSASDGPDLKNVRLLRLYEYGTLTIEGGREPRLMKEGSHSEASPSRTRSPTKGNVIYNAGTLRHGFLGTGVGEMGALYRARALHASGERMSTQDDAKSQLPVEARLRELLRLHPDARIFLGYANSYSSVLSWMRAAIVQGKKLEGFSIVLGICGGRMPSGDGVDLTVPTELFRSKDTQLLPEAANSQTVDHGDDDGCIAFISDPIPASLMALLQRRAMPFVLTTGNHSLSESIQNGHFPIYETLDFNPGVKTALENHIKHAALQLKDHIPEFVNAAIALASASPSELAKLEREISVILQHPNEIRELMHYIKTNTDVTHALIARLAALARANPRPDMRASASATPPGPGASDHGSS